MCGYLGLHVCLHVCWNQTVEICEKKNLPRFTCTRCDTCNSCRAPLKQNHSAAVYTRFAFYVCVLKNISLSFFFSPPSLLPFLAGCSIIHRQYKSGLAQQGAFQLATYSFGAVKVIRNYMMYERGAHMQITAHAQTLRVISDAEAQYPTFVSMHIVCAHTQ